MKSFFITCAFTLYLSSGFTQTVSSSCLPFGDMERIYRNDVVKIAAAHFLQTNSPLGDSVIIPPLAADSVARALYAIHNMGWSPLKDTIINLFGFSNFSALTNFEKDSSHINNAGYPYGGINYKEIQITVASNASWSSAWENHNYNNTPNAAVNYLINAYNLSVRGSGANYNISSPISINIGALKQKFAAIPGCIATYFTGYIGDGNSITTNYDAEGIILTYNNNCGDCPAGCTYGRKWKFKVNLSNCSVTYLSAETWGGLPIYYGVQPTCTRGAVLPIIFNSINASLKNSRPIVEWSVASELNIEKYIIERSVDGVQFLKAGFVIANKTSAGSSYVWTDNAVSANGNIYYRVKAIERSGETKFTQIVKLFLGRTVPVLIYPNPVRDRVLHVQLNSTGRYALSLFTIEGKKILTTLVDDRTKSVQLPTHVKAGTYILAVDGDRNSKTEVGRFVIQLAMLILYK